MSIDLAARTLKAAAEPTRVRLLLLLGRGEATVGELQEILEQSQPRVSRHLRLLAEVGLLERFRDGQSIYYRLAGDELPQAIASVVSDAAGCNDPLVLADAAALDHMRRARQRAAFSGPALVAAAQTGGRPPLEELQAVLDELLAGQDFNEVLDVGCGGGALLPWLSARAERVTGADIARPMRLLARSRLQVAGLSNCTIRDADLHSLPFTDDAFDLVLLDEVLSRTRNLADAWQEVQRVLRPRGRVVVLDRIEPAARQLAANRQGLAENQLTSALAGAGLRVIERRWLPGRALDYAAIVASPLTAIEGTGTDG
ncbi:MAG: ArsR/SmtB family transcription factor [Gammaproteobacteria bacterium]